ncbi:MAG TPA: carboxypeptidase regulatory-like domain-containing protein [Puia sp.]|nr:carboxypeptidase regulatory-like domain-containing protein [Puia sp.]
MTKRLVLSVFSFLLLFAVNAQVTTSGISGIVRNSKNEILPGSTIIATHVPSGTVYNTVALSDGRFTISNMRVGGPYTVEISFAGYNTRTYNDISLPLGAPLRLEAVLEDNSKSLEQVTVTYQRNPLISPKRQGPSLQISQNELQTLPTITRNVDDYVRLVPQAQPRRSNTDGSTMGTAFAGQSNKYNQFTIDGANATDVFGLAASGTNGGQAALNPIPFDAIEQVQVILAPYDVTLSGFTGGGVNAVTRSGTNTFHGSVYGFNQNQGLVGKSADTKAALSTFHDWQYGARLGGPIIKNKLFFFVNYEGERRSQPPANLPGTPQSSIRTSALDSLSAFLKDEGQHAGWSYDPGPYNNFNSEKKSDAIFARIDWNIDKKDKLTIRHSFVKGVNFNFFQTSPTAMSYYNNAYNFNSTNNSTVLELNSNISSKYSNMLRITFTSTKDSRATPGSLFPAVKINDNGASYNFGTEYSSQANSLNQNTVTLTDNFNIYAGRHTFTVGTDNQFYNSKNVFLQGLVGSYTYNSLSDFYNDASGVPTAYASQYQTVYSTDPKNPKPVANVKAMQLGFYAQDAFAVSDNFNLTYGLRADIPIFLGKPAANDAFNSSEIAIDNNVATNKVPSTKILLSPRIGFNWDVTGDRMTQVRGGVGIFTGRTPFVWISNQYSNTGIGTISSTLNAAAVQSNDVHFNPNAPFHPSTGVGPGINVTDPDFKYPRTLRANLAIDRRLPWGMVATLEGIYTKTLQDILYHDLNLAPASGQLILGNTTRPWYNAGKVDPGYSNIYALSNTTKGYAYNIALSLTKVFSKGWSGMLAYSLGHSYGVIDGTSSTAASNYRYNYNINGLNNVDMARNNYDQGSRIVGYVGKKFTYGKIFSTTIGLVYNGNSGATFSYVYFGDINGDDGSTVAKLSTAGGADLIYMPSDASQFVAKNGLTPDEQFAAFQTYMNSTKYLKDHIGKNTERNGDRLPWESHFDLKLEEGIAFYKQHTLSITVNIFNFSNLLSNKWGHSYYLANQEAQPINVDHFVDNGNGTVTPYYYFNPTYGLNKYTNKPWGYNDFMSRWNMQLGLRYSF